MTRYTNECVQCGLTCMKDVCPYRNVPHLICDECDRERKLYHYDNEELCIDCIEKRLEAVEA